MRQDKLKITKVHGDASLKTTAILIAGIILCRGKASRKKPSALPNRGGIISWSFAPSNMQIWGDKRLQIFPRLLPMRGMAEARTRHIGEMQLSGLNSGTLNFGNIPLRSLVLVRVVWTSSLAVPCDADTLRELPNLDIRRLLVLVLRRTMTRDKWRPPHQPRVEDSRNKVYSIGEMVCGIARRWFSLLSGSSVARWGPQDRGRPESRIFLRGPVTSVSMSSARVQSVVHVTPPPSTHNSGFYWHLHPTRRCGTESRAQSQRGLMTASGPWPLMSRPSSPALRPRRTLLRRRTTEPSSCLVQD
jgi:hypothetical protein